VYLSLNLIKAVTLVSHMASSIDIVNSFRIVTGLFKKQKRPEGEKYEEN